MGKFIYLLFFLFSFLAHSQTSIGFSDNFSGIQSVIFNPANIVDSFYKTDVNIFSGDLNFGNNAIAFNPLKALGDVDFKVNRFGSLDEYIKSEDFSNDSNYYTNNRILGPSFMMNLNKQTSIAFTTAIKTYGTVFNIDADVYNRINDEVYINNPERLLTDTFDEIGGNGNIFSWAEIGFTYAKVLLHKQDQFLKYGVSLKFLRGIRAFSVSLENFGSDLNLNITDPLNSTVDIGGDVNISYSDKGANYGQGIDIGFVYEKRNKTLAYKLKDKDGVYYSKSPYQYKVSASITDIGFLSFNNTRTHKSSFGISLPNDTIELNDYLVISSNNRKKETYILPTTAHLNLDYNLKPHWFINTNVDLYLLSNNNIKNIKSVSNLTVSTRYESQHFSAYLPMSINKFGIFKTGIGFRTGYFFLGSSSLLTNITNYSKEVDLFLGFKVPIYNKKVIKEYKNRFRHHVIE